MDRRTFLLGLAPQQRPPNIVVILADDLGYGDPGCYNPESKIPTPNIDRLAGQGMRFTDMHSPSAVCTPTRYGLLTGRYCWRTSLKKGVLNGYSPNLIEAGRPTLATLLKSRGYHTACVGKWHLGLGSDAKADFSGALHPNPTDHDFDEFFGLPASLDMPPYLYVENDRAVEQPVLNSPGNKPDGSRGAFWRPGPIAPGFDLDQVLPTLTERSVQFIRHGPHKRQPFFLYFAMTGPHTPWLATEKFRGRSRAGDYGDFVAQVDDSVGQVLKAIDRAGEADRTLVVFASDNGGYWQDDLIKSTGHRSNANWRGMKADIYEAGHRVPFLLRWPGHVKPGTVSDQLGCLTDLFATFAPVAGAAVPDTVAEDSFDLFARTRRDLIAHSSEGVFAIRLDRWKLIEGRGSGGFTQPVTIRPAAGEPPGELYDLQTDPGETRNLYQAQPVLVAELTALLDRYRRQGGSRPA